MDLMKAIEEMVEGAQSFLKGLFDTEGTIPEVQESEPQDDDESADEEEQEEPAETVRATIKAASRDMDPVTLQGWSRVTFTCEDGEERKMYFPGENGVHLVAGERGILEHRNGAFISFEKDSGEVVGVLFHIPAGEEEE